MIRRGEHHSQNLEIGDYGAIYEIYRDKNRVVISFIGMEKKSMATSQRHFEKGVHPL